MTTEALAFTSGPLIGLAPDNPRPQIRELPSHLTRKGLKSKAQIDGKIPEDLWNERGKAVEQKVQDVIASQTNIVLDVSANSRIDADGPDLHVFFRQDFPIGDVWIEVKSSTTTVGDYKDKIKNSLPGEKRNMEEVHRWMTEHRIILINGGEANGREKTPQEILADSFHPQLKRIIISELEQKGEVPIFPQPYELMTLPIEGGEK